MGENELFFMFYWILGELLSSQPLDGALSLSPVNPGLFFSSFILETDVLK